MLNGILLVVCCFRWCHPLETLQGIWTFSTLDSANIQHVKIVIRFTRKYNPNYHFRNGLRLDHCWAQVSNSNDEHSYPSHFYWMVRCRWWIDTFRIRRKDELFNNSDTCIGIHYDPNWSKSCACWAKIFAAYIMVGLGKLSYLRTDQWTICSI